MVLSLDFTFNASALQGKEVVVFEELYQDNILVAIHAEIEDKGQTVKFKEGKSEQPKPEQPNSGKNTTTPEQPNEQVKNNHNLRKKFNLKLDGYRKQVLILQVGSLWLQEHYC